MDDTNDLSDLSDDDIRQLVALGVIPDQQKQMQGQVAQAYALRNSGLNSLGQASYAGRRVVAPGPLATLGGLAKAYMGNMQLQQLQDKYGSQASQQIAGRLAFINALRRKNNTNVLQSVPPVDPNDVPAPTDVQ